MGSSTTIGHDLTYDELLRTRPESNRFEELIDGELIVMTGPEIPHQQTVARIHYRLMRYVEENGGEALAGPVDVLVDQRRVLQPDVLLVTADWLRYHELVRPVTAPPDLIVEVLSPSNRRHDLVRKRAIYEELGAPELWFVDTDTRTVEQCVLTDGRYRPLTHAAGDHVTATHLDALAVSVNELFA